MPDALIPETLPLAQVPLLTVAELEADPHGVFRRHRTLTPFIAHEAGGYVVLRAGDVAALFNDPRIQATETLFPTMQGVTEGPLYALFEHSMLTANGPVHRRRRAPFTRTFAAAMIEELRAHVRATAERLVNVWEQSAPIDFVETFAAPIPARTISTMLGVPDMDIPHFTRLVYSVSRFIGLSYQPSDLPEIAAAASELETYVASLIERRRAHPVDDFLTSFLAEAEEKGELTAFEIVFQLIGVIIGGTDTTRVAIAMLVALLLQHRDQWDAARADATLIPKAVLEAMRFEPSIASTFRMTLADIELDRRTLPAASFLTLSLMSAMRDDEVYTDPDTFDIHRTDHPRRHPVFGGGPHRCIGEALSRVEMEESLAVLLRRVPDLRLDGPPPLVFGHTGIRRMSPMYVAF